MFAKIFTQIFDSSIVEHPEVRFTFMDLLVLCDPNGVVDMTHEAIARRTNRPLETIRATIAVLEQPDARSRTPDADGARLKRLDGHRDWGWLIVNYERFRQTASEEQRREKTKARVRRHREEMQAGIEGNAPVTPCNAVKRTKRQEEEEEEGEAKAEKKEGGLDLNSARLNDSPPPNWTPSELQLRLGNLFRRKTSTRWTVQELKSFKTNVSTDTPNEDLERLEKYYRAMAKVPTDKDYRRRDLQTLLNNFAGELDRARNFKEPTCL